jgi:E3 ubiquitin-protein ligase TRIP12
MRISYFDEVAIGIGPTKEFFTLFSREFLLRKRRLFRSMSSSSRYCRDMLGFFPAPTASPELFYVIGILCAKVILMECVIDINFNPAFFRLIRNQEVSIDEVDPTLALSLSRVEGNEALDFTYPGYPDLEMIPNGSTTSVTPELMDEYRDLVHHFTCGLDRFAGIREHFLSGFNCVLPFEAFDSLTPAEMSILINGDKRVFGEDDLRQGIEFTGFDVNSPVIPWFIAAAAKMSPAHQSSFLQFVTGFRQVPIGGLQAFHPKISIVRKPCDNESNMALPTASTCNNQLKLPEYTSEEVLWEKLILAITEGRDSFSMS